MGVINTSWLGLHLTTINGQSVGQSSSIFMNVPETKSSNLFDLWIVTDLQTRPHVGFSASVYVEHLWGARRPPTVEIEVRS